MQVQTGTFRHWESCCRDVTVNNIRRPSKISSNVKSDSLNPIRCRIKQTNEYIMKCNIIHTIDRPQHLLCRRLLFLNFESTTKHIFIHQDEAFPIGSPLQAPCLEFFCQSGDQPMPWRKKNIQDTTYSRVPQYTPPSPPQIHSQTPIRHSTYIYFWFHNKPPRCLSEQDSIGHVRRAYYA